MAIPEGEYQIRLYKTWLSVLKNFPRLNVHLINDEISDEITPSGNILLQINNSAVVLKACKKFKLI